MSYWAAMVITNLFTAIPGVGEEIAYTIWGGYSVSSNTLSRFYIIHAILPFIITYLVVAHLTLLHYEGSTTVFGSHIAGLYITFT